MKSKWKLSRMPRFCFRKNFLEVFTPKYEEFKRSTVSSSIKYPHKNFPRIVQENTISLGSCKKFRIFKKLNSFNIAVWSGHKFNIINISPNMLKMFVGSFVFTKRITREIHKKQVQSRHKRAFNKKK